MAVPKVSRARLWLITLSIPLASSLAILLIVLAVTAVRVRKSMLGNRWPVGTHRFDDATGYSLTPGFSRRMLDGSFLVRTHALGYRIARIDSDTAVRQHGILGVGCSFTFGDGVEAEQTFTYRLGELLGLPSYNYGVCSFSYVSAILQLEKLERNGTLLSLSPSQIVLGAGSWLEGRSQSPFFPTAAVQLAYPYLRESGGTLAITDGPEYWSMQHGVRFETELFPGQERQWTPSLKNYRLLMLEIAPRALVGTLLRRWQRAKLRGRGVGDVKLYDFVAARLAGLAERQGIPLAILWMPSAANELAPDELANAVKRHPTLMLVDGARAAQAAELAPGEYANRHPTAAAHRLYAETLARAIKERPGLARSPPRAGDGNPPRAR
jgi:hypothetical protein